MYVSDEGENSLALEIYQAESKEDHITDNMMVSDVLNVVESSINKKTEQVKNFVDYVGLTAKSALDNYLNHSTTDIPYNFVIKIIIRSIADIIFNNIKNYINDFIENFEYEFSKGISNEFCSIKSDIKNIIFNFVKDKFWNNNQIEYESHRLESKILNSIYPENFRSEIFSQIGYLGSNESDFDL